MKFLRFLLVGGVFFSRLHALEAIDLAAVAKRFDSPIGEDQYQARSELNRLVAQATAPGQGDCAAVTRVLVAALGSADTSQEAAKYILRALARVATAEAIAPLAKILASSDLRLKEEARAALSWNHCPQAVAALEAALTKTTDPGEQVGLVEALASQQASSSVRVIAPLMLAEDAALAGGAMAAIAQIGGPSAVASLMAVRANPKLLPARMADADRALLWASGDDAQTALRIYQSGASESVRLAAFMALMKISPASAKPALVETALKSEAADLRQAALAQGIAISLPSLQATLVQGLDQMPKDERLIVLANLDQFKPAASAEKIALGRLESAEEDERIYAITALGKFPTASAFLAVLQGVGARDPRINQAAAATLASMTCPTAEAILLAMLKGNSSPDRILALKAMSARQVPDAAAVLLGVIQGSDKESSKEALKTLYFTASVDDLRSLCAVVASTQDADLRRSLVSISHRIATRINSDEARELVKELK